jgi:hypothetical protein
MEDLISSQSFPEIGFLESHEFSQEKEQISKILFTEENKRGMSWNYPFLNTFLNDYFKFTYKIIHKCMSISTPIPNCEEYESKGICKFCKNNSILSMDRTKCLPKENLNPDALETNKKCKKQEENKGGCNICMPGYFFDLTRDACRECPAQNCLLCDADSLGECQVCKSGYFMDPSGDCLLNTFLIQDTGYGDDFVQEVSLVEGVYLVPNFDDIGNIICSVATPSGLLLLTLVSLLSMPFI